MSRPLFAIAALLTLAAATSACAPQCTCPATVPAPVGVIAVAQPPAQPVAPAAAPVAAPVAGGALRLLNADSAAAQMRLVFPRQMANAGVRGEAVVEITLDEYGAVQSASDVSLSNDQLRGPALTIAHGLKFSIPPAAGTMVRVRLRWSLGGNRAEIVEP
jgi:outer membrane biosynthesis protein TonB